MILKKRLVKKIFDIYSNDYCTIQSSENLFLISIKEPTHDIRLYFYIIKENGEN